MDEAVKRAQAMGIAERIRQRTGRLGWGGEGRCPGNVLMGANVRLEQVQRTGIRELNEEKSFLRAAGMATNWSAVRSAAAMVSIAACVRKCY